MIIDFLFFMFVRFCLWLRYRVIVRGLREVQARGKSGILFLPNHPALIDPVIVLSRLFPAFRARALADRKQIDRFFVRRLARRVNVLPIDNLAEIGSDPQTVREVIARCVEALRAGDNLVLYPAGHLLRSCREDLGGNSGVETILRELPDVRVVLVRTGGLWGSEFSWASGAAPKVSRVLRRGIGAMLTCGLFLMPRRQVSMELLEPDDLPRGADRFTINRYLADFYNSDAQPNTFVPYTLWDRRGVRTLPEPPEVAKGGDLTHVPPATRRIVLDFLRELTGRAEFDDANLLGSDLGMDSLTAAELMTWLQVEFGFTAGDPESLRTVGDVMLAACGEAISAGPRTLNPVPVKWASGPPQPDLPVGLADMTIPQAFLAQAERFPNKAIVADQVRGVKTYRNLMVGVIVLMREIEKLPGECVGIMLPASSTADVLLLATQFAGKTPAMINWTLGRRNLAHCMQIVGVERIVTSRVLVHRLASQGVDLGELEDRFVYLEDISARLSWTARLAALLKSRFNWARLRTAAATVPNPAVILFTSGSESLPKAVPLTHRNLLTNLTDVYECFTVSSRDSLLGILPPFHSFGLTTGVLLPLCIGMRAVYYPNPTDGATLGAVVEAYGATLLPGTPTFLSGIVRASTAGQLASLRLIVSGAEKCLPHVYEMLADRCPRTKVLEGYGVTECSPIVSVNHECHPQAGTIGRVMSSLEYVLVDSETMLPVSRGEAGMLLVRGPTVFDGYLNYDGPSPFVSVKGKEWYCTGDIVVEDDSGVLTFRGRRKRFVKLGGEMISLPAIEAVLLAAYSRPDDEAPPLAVTATPVEEHPEIVMFTTRPLDRESANDTLRAAGLSGLHNIRRVIHIDKLPQLGTGKTDYLTLADKLRKDL
jgi:long-chain-fatty-acid--[acyl-carrier-protein] ligase